MRTDASSGLTDVLNSVITDRATTAHSRHKQLLYGHAVLQPRARLI